MNNNPPLTAEEAAQLLKISKYTLYELVKRGEIPAQRVGRQVRIDPQALNLYLGRKGSESPTEPDVSLEVHTAFRFAGSHDPAVELLDVFLKHAAVPVAMTMSFTGSMEGLIALYKRQTEICGVHLWDDKSEEYNLPFVRYVLPGELVTIVNLVQRVQGLIVPAGNPLQIKGWDDLVRKGIRFVNRQKGSGTRLRLDAYLCKSGISPAVIDGYEVEEDTHFGVACRVADGRADVGIGIQAAALRMGLDFVPLFTERYDLVCLRETTNRPEWRQVLATINSPAFINAINNQGGYDTSLTGKEIAEK